MRNGGLSSALSILSLLLLSPHTFLINCGVSPIQVFINFCNVSPCHRLWFLMNCSSLVSSLQCHMFCQESAPLRALHKIEPSFGASFCSSVSFSLGCRQLLAPPWTSTGWRGTTSISCQHLLMEVTCTAPSAIKLCYINHGHSIGTVRSLQTVKKYNSKLQTKADVPDINLCTMSSANVISALVLQQYKINQSGFTKQHFSVKNLHY